MFAKISALAICRISIAFVWFYHGLVPKLLGPHEDELAVNTALGLSHDVAVSLSTYAGIGEIMMAAFVIVFWNRAWPLQLTALAMVMMLILVAVVVPNLLVAAFNPVTTNLCVLALALVALKLQADTEMV